MPDPTEPPSAGLLSRRTLLVGSGVLALGAGAAAAGVETGALPGRSWLYRHLGPEGPSGTAPDVAPGGVVSGRFTSTARAGRSCGWAVAYPPGHDGNLPVVVVLHGRGADHTAAFDTDYMALDRYLAAAVDDGAAPFAVASVDGGDTYWHRRRNGEDAGTMVVDEFLPLLAGNGLDVSRIGLLGWSMGGYGALHLAGLLGADRVAGVAVSSPALWHRYADTAPGAFDSADDFAAVTVFGRQDRLAGIPVRVDCGEGDPFYAATRDYVGDLDPAPAGGFQHGEHDAGYWRRMAPQQLAFLGDALTRR